MYSALIASLTAINLQPYFIQQVAAWAVKLSWLEHAYSDAQFSGWSVWTSKIVTQSLSLMYGRGLFTHA